MSNLSITSNKRSISLESADDWKKLKDENNWELMNLDGLHKQLIKKVIELESSRNKVSVILKHYDSMGGVSATEVVDIDAILASEIIDNAATAAIAIHQCSQELRDLNDLEATVLAALAGPLCESDIVSFRPVENIVLPDSHDTYFVNDDFVIQEDGSDENINLIDHKED